MESKDIIKSFEYCTNQLICDIECSYFGKKNCHNSLMEDALNLIKNQQAEIDKLTAKAKRLKKVQMQLDDMCIMHNIIKTEAYKEFAEAYKDQVLNYAGMFTDDGFYISFEAVRSGVDFILEKLTERKED